MRRADATFVALGLASLAGVAAVVFVAARHTGDAAGSPLSPPGAWRTLLWVAVVGSFVAYAMGWALSSRVRLSVAFAGAIAAGVQLAPLFGPLLLSTDARSYTSYGLAHSPYHLQDGWATPSVYGPLWTFVSEPIAHLSRPELGFRVLAAAATLGIAAGAAWLASNAAAALVFVGWNPLLALHGAGGGHNDALMIAFVVLALVCERTGRIELAGVAWAASIWIKWVTGIFWLWWVLSRRQRRRPLGLGGFVAANAILLVAAFARFGTDWLKLFRTGSSEARRQSPLGLRPWLEHLGLHHREALALAALAVLAIVVAFAVAAWRGRLRLGAGSSLLAFAQARLNPWYGYWGVSLAGADEDATGRVLALALSAVLLSDMLPR